MKKLFITKVHYENRNGNRIVKCKYRENINNYKEDYIDRETIIDYLKNNPDIEFYTLTVEGNTAKVILHPINNKDYIKTVPNDIGDDNLGELPEY